MSSTPMRPASPEELGEAQGSVELLSLPPSEVTRLRELLRHPRLYIPRRAEDVCFQRLNLAHVSVTQNITIPALPPDFDSVDNTSQTSGGPGRVLKTVLEPRIVTLGFFPKRSYLGLEAHDRYGADLPLLTLAESARLLAAILVAQWHLAYGTDDSHWTPIEKLLYQELEPLIAKPPVIKDPHARRSRSSTVIDESATANIHFEAIERQLQAWVDDNPVAHRMLGAESSALASALPHSTSVLKTLDLLTRTTLRFVLVTAAPGERVVIKHRYMERVHFERISDGPKRLRWGYAILSQLALTPRHVGFRALNHNLTQSFHLTVNAPPGTTVEYFIWAQRDRADENGWLLLDDLSARGPLVQINSLSPPSQPAAQQAIVDGQSFGDAVAGIQFSRHATARPALIVTMLLMWMLIIGVWFPSDVVLAGSGPAVVITLGLPVAAMALLVQQLPQPFTHNFAQFLRGSLWCVTGIGFLAAIFSGTGIIKSSHSMVVLSTLGLLIAAPIVCLLGRLSFASRKREDRALPRDPPYLVIARDVRDGLRYIALCLAVCTALSLALGAVGWSRI